MLATPVHAPAEFAQTFKQRTSADQPPPHFTAIPAPSSSVLTSLPIHLVQPEITAPFDAVRRLFDHLRTHPADAAALNATYPKRGILKTAATHNASSDQKFTLDLSPARAALIPPALRAALAPHGLDAVLSFFTSVSALHVPPLLRALGALAGPSADLPMQTAHAPPSLNFRLCDYNPATAAPACENGCGAHTDYGTASIIFQDGTPGLEILEPARDDDGDGAGEGQWVPVPGDATVVLAGWCAVVLSGGRIRAARHRVRRVPGVRRLSAVLFVAPAPQMPLRPLDGVVPVRRFSERVGWGELDVATFKETMGRTWRWREGNQDGAGAAGVSQDEGIERLIWG